MAAVDEQTLLHDVEQRFLRLSQKLEACEKERDDLRASQGKSDEQISAGRNGKGEGSRLDESGPDVAKTAQRLAQPHVEADRRAQRRERVGWIEDVAHRWK